MSAHEAHRSRSDEPDWIQSLRKRLDQILRWQIWPQRWRPWLGRRADDLVSLGRRLSTGRAPAAALRTPEEIARDILDETAQSSGEPAVAGAQSQSAPEAESGPEPVRPAATETAQEPTSELGADAESEPTPVTAARAEMLPGAAAETRPEARSANEAKPDERPREAPSASRTLVPEVFLEEMQEAMEIQSAQVERELDSLRSQEKTVFTLLLVAAGVALGLLVIGAALVFTGLIAVGVLSALVALLPGTGTLILRRLERRVGADKDRVAAVRRDNVQLLQAIQVTLLIEDPVGRSQKVAELSDELRKSAFGTTRSARGGTPSGIRPS
jgi:hypothetical protein